MSVEHTLSKEQSESQKPNDPAKSLILQIRGEMKKAQMDGIKTILKTKIADLEKTRLAMKAIENDIVDFLTKEGLATSDLIELLKD